MVCAVSTPATIRHFTNSSWAIPAAFATPPSHHRSAHRPPVLLIPGHPTPLIRSARVPLRRVRLRRELVLDRIARLDPHILAGGIRDARGRRRDALANGARRSVRRHLSHLARPGPLPVRRV